MKTDEEKRINIKIILQPRQIEIAPNIIEPDQSAGSSNRTQNNVFNEHSDDGYDEMCLEVLNHVEDAGLCDDPGKIFFSLYILSALDFIYFYF